MAVVSMSDYRRLNRIVVSEMVTKYGWPTHMRPRGMQIFIPFDHIDSTVKLHKQIIQILYDLNPEGLGWFDLERQNYISYWIDIDSDHVDRPLYPVEPIYSISG